MLLRIPYTSPLPVFPNLPSTATTLPLAIAAVCNFLRATPPSKSITILSGAGISVDSGLKDYRGPQGTYTSNKNYKPTFYGEFLEHDWKRRRYWARSFVGWQGVDRVKPNKGHIAVEELWRKGYVGGVITQNVDTLHQLTNPSLPVTDLHGSLRKLVCLHCHTLYSREWFQTELAKLNPIWSELVSRARSDPAFKDTLQPNPDGDIDVPDAPYNTFRYPACQNCLDSGVANVEADADGGYVSSDKVAGVLKPTLVFFGESLQNDTRLAAEAKVESEEVDGMLVLGSSLATYSAWRLVRRAKELEKRIGVVNLGGVRGEGFAFWGEVGSEERTKIEQGDGSQGVRVNFGISETLEAVNEVLGKEKGTQRRPLVSDVVQSSHGSIPMYGF